MRNERTDPRPGSNSLRGFFDNSGTREKYSPTQSNTQVLNCERTGVCDITVSNPLREAFKIVIYPMAEIRQIQSAKNGTQVNVDSIKPSSIWISPQSYDNKVSFLCLPGGIG